jgi:hypothetical protein
MQRSSWYRDECGRLIGPNVTLRFIGGSLHGQSMTMCSVFYDGFGVLSFHPAGTLCEEYRRDPVSGYLMLVNTGIAWGKELTCPIQ